MLAFFCNKPFLRHQAEDFDEDLLGKCFESEKKSFLQTVELIPMDNIVQVCNIIGSHTIYKIKINDDKSVKLKAYILSHENKESMKL